MTSLDETAAIEYQASPSMSRNNPVGFVLTLLLCLVGVGFIVLLVWWLKCRATVLTITNERSILRKGLLSKSVNEVWHEDVRNVQLNQTFFQRIFDVGSIGISSAGDAGVEIVVHGIPDPDQAKAIIDHYKRVT